MSKILVIDIETLGKYPEDGCIIEVGAVELDLESGDIKEVFSSMVKEKRLRAKHRDDSAYNWILSNSSITVDMIRCAPSEDDVYPKLQEVINQYPVGSTAFNRQFDMGFLESRGIKFPNLQPCPMLLLTPIMKLRVGSRNKWPKVTEAFPFLFPDVVDFEEHHRGASDARDEALIIYEMYRRGWYPLNQIFN